MNHTGGVHIGISKLSGGLCGQTVYKHRKKVTEMVITVTFFVTFFVIRLFANTLQK